jgi:hypothetical protein
MGTDGMPSARGKERRRGRLRRRGAAHGRREKRTSNGSRAGEGYQSGMGPNRPIILRADTRGREDEEEVEEERATRAPRAAAHQTSDRIDSKVSLATFGTFESPFAMRLPLLSHCSPREHRFQGREIRKGQITTAIEPFPRRGQNNGDSRRFYRPRCGLRGTEMGATT